MLLGKCHGAALGPFAVLCYLFESSPESVLASDAHYHAYCGVLPTVPRFPCPRPHDHLESGLPRALCSVNACYLERQATSRPGSDLFSQATSVAKVHWFQATLQGREMAILDVVARFV